MSINWQEILFNFLGGLGLFLYSIKTMGEGLQQAAGDRLRYYIDKYTSNPFLGVLVGIVVTALGSSWGLISGLRSPRSLLGLNWGLMPFQLCFLERSYFSLPRIEWPTILVGFSLGLEEFSTL